MSLEYSNSVCALSEIVVLTELLFTKDLQEDILSQLTEEHFVNRENRENFRNISVEIKRGVNVMNEFWMKKIPFSSVDHRISLDQAILFLQEGLARMKLQFYSNHLVVSLADSLPFSRITETVEELSTHANKETFMEDESISELIAQYEEQDVPETIPWGIGGLTDFPLEEGNLVIVGARPSIGKTSMACSLLLGMANQGISVGMVNLEMTSRQIMERLLSQQSNIEYKAIKRRLFASPSEVEQFKKAKDSLSKSTMSLVNIDNCSAIKIRSIVKKWVRKNNTKVVFIDYLQKIKMPEAERHDLGIGYFTSMLKDLAIKHSIVIILLVQLNRDAENRVPKLNNLKDSGRIEEDADIVMLIHRDRPNTDGTVSPYGDTTSETSVYIEKNRNGETGLRTITFYPGTMSFYGPKQ
jgi:replicative DNA helicase